MFQLAPACTLFAFGVTPDRVGEASRAVRPGPVRQKRYPPEARFALPGVNAAPKALPHANVGLLVPANSSAM